jgi:glycosyltransferase involved in cell wall biosynthesis
MSTDTAPQLRRPARARRNASPAPGPGEAAAKPRRVLLVVENVSLARDHRLRKQVSSLLAHGFAVSVICRGDPDNEAIAGSRLREYRPPADGATRLGFVREYGYSWSMAAWLTARTALSEGFDALQISGTPDIYFAIGAPFKLLGKPLVLDQRDLSPELYELRYGARGSLYRLLRRLERASWRTADHVITVNDSLAGTVRDRGGLPAESVTVVGNGPVLAHARGRAPEPGLKQGRRFLACWLGLMGPQDRVDLALHAVAHLVHVRGRDDCHFAFVGDGEARDDLQRLAADLDITEWTSFPGWLSEGEAFAYLASTDLGVEPNLQEIVSPVKGLEFMAFGVPFVAFDLAETRLLADEAAVYAPPGDVVAFAGLIDRLLDDPQQRSDRGEAGRRRIEDTLAWDRQEDAYVQVYERLLGAQPGGAAPRPLGAIRGEDAARLGAALRAAAPAALSAARRGRHRVRIAVSQYPTIYLPFARRKYPGPSPQVIGPDTEVVFEGYTRAAMTFAVYAFQLSQPEPVKLAHHLHAPAQAMAAVRAGLPTLVLIREPRGAVLSQLIREPHVAMPDALLAYARFYECLVRYRDRLVVADFEEVTHEFGAAIRRLNERFGTSYVEFAHTEENTRECLELIKLRGTLSKTLLGFESGLVSLVELQSERERLAREGESLATQEAWVPSADRDRAKAALLEEWEATSMVVLRARAEGAYRAFLGGVR